MLLQDNLDYLQWQEPRLLLECLLNYFRHHPNEIELLFHMLRCFTSRYIPQFQFFKDFLEDTIAEVCKVKNITGFVLMNQERKYSTQEAPTALHIFWAAMLQAGVTLPSSMT